MIDTKTRVRLIDIAKEYFSISPATAQRKAALGTLPVPAFRISASNKAPFFVLKSDLEALESVQYAAAQKLNRQMKEAGAV